MGGGGSIKNGGSGGCGEFEFSVVAAAMTDYKGDAPDKSSTGGWLGAGLVAVVELAERICVIGISMNLVTYLTGDLHLSASKSANIVTNFMGTLYLLALLGGFLADAKLGRYLAVAVSATIATVGVGLLTLATTLPGMRPPACGPRDRQLQPCVEATGGQLALLYLSLYVVALGAGTLKANVSGFGSDQFDTGDEKEGRAMLSFFDRFYFFISLGSLFAVTVMVYVQDNVGRGYGVSAAAMAATTMVMLAGTRRYRFQMPEGSPLTVVGRVVGQAWRKRGLSAETSELQRQTGSLRWLDRAAIPVPGERRCATLAEVEEVKMVARLLPVWATSVPFWTVYSQMTTLSVEQATYMDRRMLPGSAFTVPAGSVSVFLFLSILVFTSLNEKVVAPAMRRVTGGRRGLTSLQRAGAGLGLAAAGMAVAAAVEGRRREAAMGEGVRVSVAWLVPQYVVVGAGEAFAYVGQLEFFVRQSPERMKSMSTGLFLAALSMGFFLSSALVAAADGAGWITTDYNEGRVDKFYWMLAVLAAASLGVFVLLAGRHRYKEEEDGNAGEKVEAVV